MTYRLMLSEKDKALMRCNAPVQFLEGTTAAGKTTCGMVSFLLHVAADKSKKPSCIAGFDTGTLEKNIINSELGVMDVFGDMVTYNGGGTGASKLPHLRLKTDNGTKTIYCLGYGDKARWKKALGSQFYGLFIDEINEADMDFVREATMRADFVMGTLNPDIPDKPIYTEYINHSRPLPEWEKDEPEEIYKDLMKSEERPGWVHWFFGFADNPALTKEKIEKIKSAITPGTKIWKNKIQGLRGRSTGLVFSAFTDRNIITEQELRKRMSDGMRFVQFTAGVDTAYSSKSPDTISFIYQGITSDKKLITLGEMTFNNAGLSVPLAPSDTAAKLVSWLDRMKDTWGFTMDIFVDSADAGTLTECSKYKRNHGFLYNFIPAWKQMKIIDRVNLQNGWMAHGDYLVLDTCRAHIDELNRYSWQETKDFPEDGNDHTINANQYAWLPYAKKIGNIQTLK